MDFKNSIIFEHKRDERTYRMECPAGAPLGEAYEACGLFMDHIIKCINEHAEKMRPKPVDDKPEDCCNEKKDE